MADMPGGDAAGGDGSAAGLCEPIDSIRPPLVRLTVNLAPRAVEALDSACVRTKDTKTDTVNRALVVYSVMLEIIERSGGRLTLQTRDGNTETVFLLI
ncbi:hypothetical protein [Micromonospora echinospora]|uniref:hypothetical protein n=1 Tax=Micromonospora echinospora TaxID=1877 RepID=UPI003A837EF1